MGSPYEWVDALEAADDATDSVPFIEFILEAIDSVLQENLQSIDTESDQVTDQVTDQASDQVKSLLKILDNQYLAVPEMMERLSLSHRTYFRKNYLNPAVKLGLVEMSHPEKPRSPKQKYRKR